MSTAKNNALKIGALGLLVTLALVVAAPAIQAGVALTLGGVTVSGMTVVVQVENTSSIALSGVVGVRAVVNDTPIWSSAPVELAPGQSSGVNVTFGAPVSSVTQVAIIGDDPSPF